MKIQIASDLHLEFLEAGQVNSFLLPDVGADVLVLAGDIHQKTFGMTWAARSPAEHVIYVPGNHEYYNSHLHDIAVELRKLSVELSPPNGPVHLLDNSAVVIDGVRFLGTTLWTDFGINGVGHKQYLSILAARSAMADFNCIRLGSTSWLTPPQSVILHRAALEWLTQQLAIPFNGPTIVVTHHCPHRLSVPERFKDDVLTPGFASDLSWVMERFRPELWIHGHTHDAFDYVVPWADESGSTRVVCNPRGYPGEDKTRFDPSRVVTV